MLAISGAGAARFLHPATWLRSLTRSNNAEPELQSGGTLSHYKIKKIRRTQHDSSV
jgi:hypothetical protein